MVILFKFILPLIGLFITHGIPVAYVAKTGRFARGVFLTWGLLVLWSAFMSQLVWEIVARFLDNKLLDYLPEGNSIVAALVLGWLFGLVISTLGLSLRYLIMKFRGPKPA